MVLVDILRIRPQEWNIETGEQLLAAMLDDGHVFHESMLKEYYESYRSWVQHAHGTTVNPVTGEVLDIMTQCVALEFEDESDDKAGSSGLEEKDPNISSNTQIAQHFTYDKVLSSFFSFGATIPLYSRVWVDPDARGAKTMEGQIIACQGEGTDIVYDAQLLQALLPGWEDALREKAFEFTRDQHRFGKGELNKFIAGLGIREG